VGHGARSPGAVGRDARVPVVVPYGGKNLVPSGSTADR
jgi:hypothetical protein